jgi:hypothetical protein
MSVNWFRSSCRHSRKLARLAAAGWLSEPERSWLARHIGRCSDCRYYAAELRGIKQLLEVWDAGTPEPRVTPELSAQWQMAIEAEIQPRPITDTRSPTPTSAGSTWLGIDRAVPVSLVLIWLVTIGFHLNTPVIPRAAASADAPSLREVRVVMEWLMKSREAA